MIGGQNPLTDNKHQICLLSIAVAYLSVGLYSFQSANQIQVVTPLGRQDRTLVDENIPKTI